MSLRLSARGRRFHFMVQSFYFESRPESRTLVWLLDVIDRRGKLVDRFPEGLFTLNVGVSLVHVLQGWASHNFGAGFPAAPMCSPDGK